ncbi:hypothetical protein GCM10022252_48650 [Streptosporangium oxazolinicum]|uniref:DUF3024 domain-containing protein n=1 Tax=Streptosporangium oxazolinicum TaxID=909287 RepID=A0ABP8B542_9ACTN
MPHRDTLPPYGTTAADRAVGLVQASDALVRLRDLLHKHLIYPSISYQGGSKLHVGNEVTVWVKPTEEDLIYCWRVSRRGAAPREFKAPADNVDDVVEQIAAALYKTSRSG